MSRGRYETRPVKNLQNLGVNLWWTWDTRYEKWLEPRPFSGGTPIESHAAEITYSHNHAYEKTQHGLKIEQAQALRETNRREVIEARDLISRCVGVIIEGGELKLTSVYFKDMTDALNILNRVTSKSE